MGIVSEEAHRPYPRYRVLALTVAYSSMHPPRRGLGRTRGTKHRERAKAPCARCARSVPVSDTVVVT